MAIKKNSKKTNTAKKTKSVEKKTKTPKTKKSLSFYEWLHKWGIGYIYSLGIPAFSNPSMIISLTIVGATFS